jgi:TetR/AcrR family transcriptional regulator, transcriptional repressor for nem operon
MIAIIYFMRHSKDEKTASHERIVNAAAARIRESGTDQPGVAEIMRAAGLTHGGFYKHFDSREELIEEAVQRALTERGPELEELLAVADDPLAAFAEWYVSEAHRNNPGQGCGVVALGLDVSRVGGGAQEAYRAQVERYIALLTSMLGGDERAAAVTLSAMVGAVMIARALGSTDRSDEILRQVRDAVAERRVAPASAD